MARIKTDALKGAALDWAVAKCEGHSLPPFPGRGQTRGPKECWINVSPSSHETFSPSTDWAQGGPIIGCECIGLLFDSGSACRKPCWFATPDDQSTSCGYEGEVFDSPLFMVGECAGMYGPTPLIAAMRCYVASKLGDELDVPAELCE